jgi:hypothetical protein
MRLKVEIDELTPDQWEQAQRMLQASYEIPDGASRACLLLMHEGEERHVEMPVSKVSVLLMGLNLVATFREMSRVVDEAMRHVRDPFHNSDTGGHVAAMDRYLPPHSKECDDQDDDRPCLLDCPVRKVDLSKCKCGFRAPELGPHPMCPVHK